MKGKKYADLLLTTTLVFSLLPSHLVIAHPDETIQSVEADLEISSQDPEEVQINSEEAAKNKNQPEDTQTEDTQLEISEEEVIIESETEQVPQLALADETNVIRLITSDKGEISRTLILENPGKTYADMRVAVWTSEGGQDDLRWYKMTRNADGSWKADIYLTNLKHSGKTYFHVYTGDSTFLGGIKETFTEDDISKYPYTIEENGDSRIVTINTSVSHTDMRIAVWSEENGQDDLKWYDLTKQSDGSWKGEFSLSALKHDGEINIHLYTGYNSKAICLREITVTINAEELKELNLKAASKDYTTTLTMTTGKTYSKMKAAIWSQENDQDDLQWYTMAKQTDGSWKITIENSSLKHSGSIIVHFYSGSTFLGEKRFEMTEADLPRNSVQITGFGDSRTITVTTSKILSNLRVAIWSETKGQDDLKWYSMKQKSSNVWSVTIKTSNLLHSGICNAHVYTDTATQIGAETFTVEESEVHKNQLTITGSGTSRKIRLTNPAASYTSVTVAVWSETSGQDDLQWLSMKKDSSGAWVLSYPISKLNHSRTCHAHVYTTGNKLLTAGSFYVSDADYFQGLLTYGNDSNIDFVQCAVNIAKNDSIGYGHAWPATISCSGLISLSLTYCGYGDFVSNDRMGWGYLDLCPEFVQELMKIGCTTLMGPWSKKNISQLKPGDILYTYVDDNNCHAGIYLGNGLTVEARGPSGSDDTDSSGREIAIYDITTEPTSFQVVYRLNSLHTIRNT